MSQQYSLFLWRVSHLPRQRFKLAAVSHRQISTYGYEQSKALAFHNYGQPESALFLHSHSISPAHGKLLTLRFLASPINPADINQIQGVYPSAPNFTTALGTPEPIAVGGNEGVAEVIATGTGVKSLARGDWVIMKNPGFGTWRTHAQTTEDNLLKIADKSGVTAAQAGTVSINPCTAYRILKDFVKMEEGQWFIQNGANSSVGRAVIQLGRLWGYKSINIIRSRPSGLPELKQELCDLGADIVVTDEEAQAGEFNEKVREWTNGGQQPLSLGLNCVGGRSTTAIAKVLSPDGQLVTYGAMSKMPVQLPTSLLIFKNISFKGFWVSKWGEHNSVEKAKTVQHVLQLIREGKFKDPPLEEILWDADTSKDYLIKAVTGALKGFKPGKSIFIFQDT